MAEEQPAETLAALEGFFTSRAYHGLSKQAERTMFKLWLPLKIKKPAVTRP